MNKLVFLDTETTGLDPERHEIWEVAAIVREDYDPGIAPVRSYIETEHLWQLPVDVAAADLIALNIGGWNARRLRGLRLTNSTDLAARVGWEGESEESPSLGPGLTRLEDFAAQFSALTWGAHLVGAVPSFDAQRLERLLKANGSIAGWHYHLIDVEALAVGCLYGRKHKHGDDPGCHEALPWKSRELSTAFGVDPEQYPAHTALGDARWARDLYDAIAVP